MERRELPWATTRTFLPAWMSGQDMGLEVGQGPGGGVFEGFALRAGRGDVVGAPPDLAPALRRTGRRSRPCSSLAGRRNGARSAPGRARSAGRACRRLRGRSGRIDGPLQDRRIELVNGQIAQVLPRDAGFFFAARGQRHVHPAGEAVFQVPLRLAVSQQDQFGHVRGRLLAREFCRRRVYPQTTKRPQECSCGLRDGWSSQTPVCWRANLADDGDLIPLAPVGRQPGQDREDDADDPNKGASRARMTVMPRSEHNHD